MEGRRIALLTSGGLDSCVLLADLAWQGSEVHPAYIRQGLRWERDELDALSHYLRRFTHPGIRALQVLEMPVADAYGEHWSLGGAVPDGSTADSAVYLPGRNLLLLSKLAVWCDMQGISTIALAPLEGNPFGDNSDTFYTGLADVLETALGRRFEILRPYANLTKADVVRRGATLALENSLSCIQPSRGKHCGLCNKCAERRRGFAEAGVTDPTYYVDSASGDHGAL